MKKAEREEKEKLEAKEKEQKRIASGKDMGAIRQQIEEQEIKKMAEQRRREKQVSIQLGCRAVKDLLILFIFAGGEGCEGEGVGPD